MKKELLKYLCCPINHDDLTIEESNEKSDGSLQSGLLVSTHGRKYCITNGIPNLIPFDPSISTQEKEPLYQRITVPHDQLLQKNGISGKEIATMDALRYSIFVLTSNLSKKYMKGTVLEVGG